MPSEQRSAVLVYVHNRYLVTASPVKIFRSHLCSWHGSVKVHSSRYAGHFFFTPRVRQNAIVRLVCVAVCTEFLSCLSICECVDKILTLGIFFWSGEGATQFGITWNPFKIGLQQYFPFTLVVLASLRSA